MEDADAETVRVTPSASPFCLFYSITVLIFESLQVRNSVEELVHVGGGEQEGRGFKAIPGYTASLRPAWVT